MIYRFGPFTFTTAGIEARAHHFKISIHEVLLDLTTQFGQPHIYRG